MVAVLLSFGLIFFGLFAFRLLSFDGPALSQHVKVKWLTIESECLVVKEQFGHETQILTVGSLQSAVQLKHAYIAISIDLIPRRRDPRASQFVLLELFLVCVKVHAHVAHEQSVTVVCRGEGRKVPGLEFLIGKADLHIVDSFDLGCLLVFLDLSSIHSLVLIVFKETFDLRQLSCTDLLLLLHLFFVLSDQHLALSLVDLVCLRAQVFLQNPSVHPAVLALIGDVVLESCQVLTILL